jgi:hypothetical protein
MVKSCEKCGLNIAMFFINSRAKDGNYFKLNDLEEKTGYAPDVPGLCESDGCNMTVCLECGWIQGLNLRTAKDQVEREYMDDQDSDMTTEDIMTQHLPKDFVAKPMKFRGGVIGKIIVKSPKKRSATKTKSKKTSTKTPKKVIKTLKKGTVTKLKRTKSTIQKKTSTKKRLAKKSTLTKTKAKRS